MQEFYENHEEALEVLTNYAFDSSFPPNPNAYVYLYQYLLKHSDASHKKLRNVLKVSVCTFNLSESTSKNCEAVGFSFLVP